MTVDEAKKVNLGFYLIFWTSGGMSKALITQDSHGTRIVTCANWLSDGHDMPLTHYSKDIAKMVFIF